VNHVSVAISRWREAASQRSDGFRQAGELLPVEAIDPSGYAIRSDGAYVRAIEVVPPNTHLLSREEAQRIAGGYGQLLSRLRPGQSLQFWVDSRPVDLGEVLVESRAEVEAAAGPIDAAMGGEPGDGESLARWRLYAGMEDSLRRHASEQAAVRMRSLVIVPYLPRRRQGPSVRAFLPFGGGETPELRRELPEHRRFAQESLSHTQMVRAELDALRIPARLLNGEELVELYWSAFNPTAADHGSRVRASRAELLVDLDTPRSVAEGREAARRLRAELARSSIDFERSPRYLEIDHDVVQVLHAESSADGTFPGVLMGAMLTREPFTMSVFCHALDRHAERRRLKRQYRRIFAINRGREAQGRPVDFDARELEAEKQEVLAQFAREGRANLFRVSIYHAPRVRGPEPDLHRLAEAVDHCADEIELATDARVAKGEFNQRALWLSTLPVGRDVAGKGRRYATRNAGDLVPLTGTICGSPEGIPFGFSEPLRTLELLNPWDRTHSNFLGVVSGRSGSGKTVAANLITARCVARGVQAFIIDRAGHYSLLVSLIPGAQEVELGSAESDFAINPWDVDDPASVSREKISFLLALHAAMMGEEGFTVLERNHLAAAIRGVYLRASLEDVVPRETLLVEELELRASEERESGSAEVAATLKNLAQRLSEFCGDGVYSYLADRETTVPEDAPLVVFDTRSCPEDVIGAQMFAILEFVQRRIERRRAGRRCEGRAAWADRSMLVVDEFWHVLRRPETGGYANDYARRSRHLGLFMLVLTQQVSDFSTPEGMALLRNSTIRLFLNQIPEEAAQIGEVFDLSAEEAALLTALSTAKGSHSELFFDNGVRGRGKISLPLGPLEYWAFTSEPTHDVPLRTRMLERHDGDAWAAIHELAREYDPTAASELERAA
jgi:hypothetical protein